MPRGHCHATIFICVSRMTIRQLNARWTNQTAGRLILEGNLGRWVMAPSRGRRLLAGVWWLCGKVMERVIFFRHPQSVRLPTGRHTPETSTPSIIRSRLSVRTCWVLTPAKLPMLGPPPAPSTLFIWFWHFVSALIRTIELTDPLFSVESPRCWCSREPFTQRCTVHVNAARF